MKLLTRAAFLLAICIQTSICFAGPFGFAYGSTKDDIIKLVGRQAVLKEDKHGLILSTAPKSHPAFERYFCFFSPKRGLVKIVGYGKDIDTSSAGTELRSSFQEIQTALVGTYGEPKDKFDYLQAGSIWNEYRDWMMGLLKHERTLSTYWEFQKPGESHITEISLEAEASASDQGRLVLAYEFEGFGELANEIKAEKDGVL